MYKRQPYQRFTCVRLLRRYLTGSLPAFSTDAHHASCYPGAALGGLESGPVTPLRGAFPHQLCSMLFQALSLSAASWRNQPTNFSQIANFDPRFSNKSPTAPTLKCSYHGAGRWLPSASSAPLLACLDRSSSARTRVDEPSDLAGFCRLQYRGCGRRQTSRHADSIGGRIAKRLVILFAEYCDRRPRWQPC